MSMIKYRVHEVAKDFNTTSKVITQILTDYATTPKNHMQVLENNELDVIFEYLTQHNQAESLADIFASAPKAGEAKPAEKKQEKTAAAKPAEKAHTAQQPAPEKKEKENKPHVPRQVAEKRVVDTRGSAAVNIAKYDEKFDNMAGDKSRNRDRDRKGGKEKIVNKAKQRQQGQAASAKRRQEERDKMQKLQLEIAKKQQLKVMIPDEINVGELAARMKKSAGEVIKRLIKLGVFASVSDVVDYDTAALVAMEFGCKVEKEVVVTVEEKLIDDHEDSADELVGRAPVVVVMGHVDHGKTSLLDYIRHANVASGEAGGITQHIGAYTVEINGSPITFLDTPGHEAFTSMRARGAMVTDIAILVVAADDGIMPQTIESINHAKAAGIPLVVAINKMDTVGANPERIKQQLTEYDIVPEEWGGDTIVCPISAKTGEGIDNLLENLVILAEVQELKANPKRKARGLVIEAELDKGRGPVATVLVQKGTLHVGDFISAGVAHGKVRAMIDDKGRRVKEAGPSTPVEILGLSDVPSAGEVFLAHDNDKTAKSYAETYLAQNKEKMLEETKGRMSLDDLFSQIQEGNLKELNLIVKADVQGSVEAVKQSLMKLSNEEVVVKCIHGGVGAINESDVSLASASNAIIIGFNVRPDATAKATAEREGVDVRLYKVIYQAIEDVEAAMKGMLDPVYEEKVIGHAEVRQIFKASGVGTIAGSYVLDGTFQRGCKVRISREGNQIFEGNLASLKRFKDDVKEVRSGYECGLVFEGFNDLQEFDQVEAYIMVEVPR